MFTFLNATYPLYLLHLTNLLAFVEEVGRCLKIAPNYRKMSYIESDYLPSCAVFILTDFTFSKIMLLHILF